MTEEAINPFQGFRYYLMVSFTYITFGILFGALNALRIAGIFEVQEIHQTHWTSTLIGGMTVLMMGLIFYILSTHLQRPSWIDQAMYVVLGILILSTISNYIDAWFPDAVLGQFFDELVKLASFIYLVCIILMVVQNWGKLTQQIATIPLLGAVMWMSIAQLIFLGPGGLIGPKFKIPYIYGFFSLTLFGSLYFLLPMKFKSGKKTLGNMWRDTILVSLSAVSLLTNEYVNLSSLLGLIGSLLWGLVGFMFILYIFDLIFKNGMEPSLLGLSLALVMFGFFVFDTFMKSVFPVWVSSSHAHFMFLGTLLISIVSIVISYEEDKQQDNKLYRISLFLVMITVSMVLLGFVIAALNHDLGFTIVGHSGLALFGSVLLLEIIHFRS